MVSIPGSIVDSQILPEIDLDLEPMPTLPTEEDLVSKNNPDIND